MISKETILKTAITYWSNDDECFVTQSPLFSRTAGIGETEIKAEEHFHEMLNCAYEELKSGKVSGYNKAGRPSKGNVDFHAQINPASKEALGLLAEHFNISQGDVIDYLVFFQQVKSAETIESKDKVTLANVSDSNAVNSMAQAIRQLTEMLCKEKMHSTNSLFGNQYIIDGLGSGVYVGQIAATTEPQFQVIELPRKPSSVQLLAMA
jgi:hypothetical protein